MPSSQAVSLDKPLTWAPRCRGLCPSLSHTHTHTARARLAHDLPHSPQPQGVQISPKRSPLPSVWVNACAPSRGVGDTGGWGALVFVLTLNTKARLQCATCQMGQGMGWNFSRCDSMHRTPWPEFQQKQMLFVFIALVHYDNGLKCHSPQTPWSLPMHCHITGAFIEVK